MNHQVSLIIPVFSISDSFLLTYVQKLMYNSPSTIVIIDVSGALRPSPEMKETIRSIEQGAPGQISIHEEAIEKEFLAQQDLMLISLDSWKKAIDEQAK